MIENSAISGTRKSAKELADGTLRVSIDIEPRDKAQFHALFPEIDMPIAIAPLVPVTEGLQQSESWPGDIVHTEGAAVDQVMESYGKYGQQAKELRLSSFFRRPDVWRAVGSDQEFLDWLKTQDCAAIGMPHNGSIVPAHVRRVANGSGTGIKPEYSAIPLCNHHHSLQHLQGESVIGQREWWDKKRIEYLVKWCWWSLKGQFGYTTWSDVPPVDVVIWASDNDVYSYLPDCYKNSEKT